MDWEKWLCRVKIGELETNWINCLRCWSEVAALGGPPSLDEPVVLLSMVGSLETAFELLSFTPISLRRSRIPWTVT
ncbi:TPA: phage baseplate assembly protein V [Pluralibacter gergoviae]|nr:hypothetical protein [Pluralibacter gergoviae]HDS1151354.1 phage baseplate assembly protein V [Pluralibacter gergoviae]